MKLIIDAPDEIVKKGFEGPLTDEERQILIRAIGNGTTYKVEGDLISREALREKAYTAVILEPNEEGIDYVKDQRYVVDLEDIDNAPTVEERPQGEWIEVDIKPTPYGGYTCNRKCKRCNYFTKEYRLNYCPNCGADMKGGAE